MVHRRGGDAASGRGGGAFLAAFIPKSVLASAGFVLQTSVCVKKPSTTRKKRIPSAAP